MTIKTLNIDSYIQQIEDSFKRVERNLVNSCGKLNQISLRSEKSIEASLTSQNSISNDEIINRLKENILSKKEEKFFWSRFFDFDKEEILLLQNKSKLTDNQIIKILLRTWTFSKAENKNDSLGVLNLIIQPPDFLSNWRDLADKNQLLLYAEKFGENLLLGAKEVNYPFRRSSYFSLYLISQYLYNFASKDFLEIELPKLQLDSELKHFFSLNDSNIVFDEIHFVFIAAMLRMIKNEHSNSFFNIHNQLLFFKNNDNFLDPRSYPLSRNWEKVKSFDSEAFDDWKSKFNEADITFFFNELSQIHPERKAFWLDYKRTALKVILVLDIATRSKLENKYQEDLKISQIISRICVYEKNNIARQFLIILFFRDYVIVEGSSTGFGCQVYYAENFKKRFFDSFYELNDQNIISESSFESFRGYKSSSSDSWKHQGEWQYRFKMKLQALGIYRDQKNDNVSTDRSDNFPYRNDSINNTISIDDDDDVAKDTDSEENSILIDDDDDVAKGTASKENNILVDEKDVEMIYQLMEILDNYNFDKEYSFSSLVLNKLHLPRNNFFLKKIISAKKYLYLNNLIYLTEKHSIHLTPEGKFLYGKGFEAFKSYFLSKR